MTNAAEDQRIPPASDQKYLDAKKDAKKDARKDAKKDARKEVSVRIDVEAQEVQFLKIFPRQI